jgi:hypothetical protein
MSELAPGAVSLDDETPLSELAETPPPPVETPPPPVQSADDAEVETIVNPNGEKLVPLGALAGAREKARAEKEARERLEAELAPLREKASRLDQIKGEWDAAQPALQHARSLQQQQQQQQKAAGPLSEQEAIEYAKDLDLYKTDGTPDIARAQRLAARQEALAEKQAQRYVQPLQQASAQQQSAANLQVVSTWKDATGATVDPAILRELWQTMPAEMTAQPNIAAVMYRVAIGETVLRGKHKAPTTPPPPVVETAPLGGGGNTRAELSSVERSFISAVDMKPKDYEDISSRFKPGERNSLE